MTILYKRMLPVIILVTGVVVLGLAISLNIYSYFHPKQGVITIKLSGENNYTAVQPLFFNYHGYVEVALIDPGPGDKVYLKTNSDSHVLDERNVKVSLTLSRGGHRLYFNSSSPVTLELRVEDFLITHGENTILLLAGTALTVLGVLSTAYYARRKLVPL